MNAEEFAQLAAEGYNRVPVVFETLADLDTPLSTYLKIAKGPYSYLLESIMPPADVLFVGDSTTDVASARAAGCAIVCVPEGYNHDVPATELGADGIIDSLQDLV